MGTTQALRAVLLLAHLAAAAAWIGAMAYSLAIVQPRARRFLGDAARYEEFATALAAGARRGVLALIAVLGASGAALVAVEVSRARDPGVGWTVLVAAKALLLVAAAAIFAHVSWRLWPARLFARADELEALQRRFRATALVLTAVVATAFALGAVAGAIR
jgi:uncharacterized membrane protein